jgi:hypothetical protein
LIACQIGHLWLVDLSVKKNMVSATRYVTISNLADGLSFNAYDMFS